MALLLLVRQVRLIRERGEIGRAYRGDPKPPHPYPGRLKRAAAPEKPTEPPKVGAPKPPPSMDLRTGMKAPKEKGYNPPPVENVVRPEPTPTPPAKNFEVQHDSQIEELRRMRRLLERIERRVGGNVY